MARSFESGVMVAWAGVEHLRLGMFEEPPDQDEPDDVRVWYLGLVRFRDYTNMIFLLCVRWMVQASYLAKVCVVHSCGFVLIWALYLSTEDGHFLMDHDRLICDLDGNLGKFTKKDRVKHDL